MHPFLRIFAAVPCWWRCLIDAALGVLRTVQADMEVVVMPPPGPDFPQPRFVALLVITHFDLGAGKDENAGNARVLGGGLQDLVMLRRPLVVYVGAIRAAQRD